MTDGTRTLTLNDSTCAFHPGGARVSFWRWTLRYPRWPAGLITVLIGVGWLSLTSSVWWVIAVALVAAAKFLYWRRVVEHFANGDACTGVVLSEKPLRVAVFTDVTKGYGSFPVIKVIKEASYQRWHDKPQVGQRVATVALYEDHLDEGEERAYWKDFHPVIAAPVVRTRHDLIVVEQALNPENWEQLQETLKSLESTTEGLHRVVVGDHDWPV